MEQHSSDNKRTFGIYFRPSSEKARNAASDIADFLRQNNADTISLEEISAGRSAEAIISLGGDGTMLHAARMAAPLDIPVLGINFGHIGYLCATTSGHINEAIQALISGRFKTSSHNMIRCRVFDGGQPVWENHALNEFLIGGCNRTVTLEISIDGTKFCTMRGDGIIMSTKTGSTAYSFSAGGPVLLIEDAFCLVASNAVFSSSIHSLVLPSASVVRIKNLTEASKPFAVADGQNDFVLGRGMEAELGLSEHKARLIELRENNSPIMELHRSFRDTLMRELGTDITETA